MCTDSRFLDRPQRLAVYTWLACSAACVDLPDPSTTSRQTITTKGDAYYTYDGNPIYLNVDPAHITLSPTPGMPDDSLRTALAGAGLARAQARPSYASGGLVELALPPGASAQDAVDVVARLRRDPAFGFVANGYRTQAGDAIALRDRLIVHLHDGEGADAIARFAHDLGTRLVRAPLGKDGEYLLAYPPGVDPLDFALTIADQPEVAWVDPDKAQDRRLHVVPTDPYFADQYYARNPATWNGVNVDDNAVFAWDLSGGAWAPSAGPFVVAVLDDGVQIAHPDLASNFVFGFDALNNSWGSFGCTDCATSPSGDFSHGTAVAGIIKAQRDNGLGLAGIAPDVTLLPVRIFRNGIAGSDAQLALGIDAAWQNGAQVLNNSWGGGSPSNAITAAINRATTQGRNGLGSVVVFSAGNTSARQLGIIGGVAYPARLPNVIAVGAIDRNGALTDYSPEGAELDLVAPSGHFTNSCVGDVVTIDLLGVPGCSDGPQGDVDYSSTFSGTSAAAPQVASVAAMVIARSPSLTEAQVRAVLTGSADPWGAATQFGAGKLNAYRALVGRLRVNIDGDQEPASPGIYQYTANVSGGVGGYTYQWSVSPSTAASSCSTGPTCSVRVARGAHILLRLTAVNGPDNQQVTSVIGVDGPTSIPTCGPHKAC
jgi:subtilisin family serine protease